MIPAALVAAGPAAAAAPEPTAVAAAERAAALERLAPPTAKRAWIAHLVIRTAVRSRPGGRVTDRLGTSAPWAGGPVRLLVLDKHRDARGAMWLKVRLQRRPNTATGWLPADNAAISETPWRIVLDRSSRMLTVRRGGRVVRRMSAVVGAPGTPTPTGLFAIAERVRQGRGSVLGPWALHLTAHSDVLDDFGGGAGRVAIHGRAGALLGDPLGSARSHGCVRVASRQVSWLAARLREGTPVLIRP